MVDRAEAGVGTDPRTSSESVLEIRLAALANALGRTLRDLRDRLESVERRVTDRVNSIDQRVAETVDVIERRVSDIPEIASQTTTDLRAVLRHLEALQQRVGAAPDDLAEKVGRIDQRLSALPEQIAGRFDRKVEEGVTSIPDEVAARVDQATEGMRKSFEALPSAFAQSLEPFRGLPKRIEEAMDSVEEMRNRVAALEGGINQVRDEGGTASERLLKDVAEMFHRMEASLEEQYTKLREETTSDTTGMAEKIAQLEARVGELKDQLADPVEIANAARESTEQALARADLDKVTREATESAMRGFGEDQERRAKALEKALGRVDRLSEALDSLEKRRGARELLEGEQRLVEQQEALFKSVSETANELGGRVLAIEGEISAILERVADERLSRELGDHVKGAVADLRQSIGHDLGRRLSNAIAHISKAAADRVADDVGARVENLREELAEEATKAGTEVFERAGAQMSEEIHAMRAKIDSWGKSRTAPKVAEELAAMNKRIDKVALTVEEELVDAVFDRMQRVFDRRFEVLIQLVETRVREALEKREEPPTSHRRRFLRRSDEDDD